MNTDSFSAFFDGHVPEVMMIIAGLIAFLIVFQYRKDKESRTYKAVSVIGAVVGASIIIFSLTRYSSWSTFDAVLVFLAGFTLFIRPFTKVDFVFFLALIIMGVVYLWLGQLTGDFAALATGWPRVIAAVIAGALIYMILHFVQSIVQMIGKFLNCWPVLLVLGVICLLEGALMLAGQPSLFTLYQGH